MLPISHIHTNLSLSLFHVQKTKVQELLDRERKVQGTSGGGSNGEKEVADAPKEP